MKYLVLSHYHNLFSPSLNVCFQENILYQYFNIWFKFKSNDSSIVMMQILARRILCCGSNRQIHTDYRNPVEKKGWHGHSLSERGQEGYRAQERELTPAWTGFYCFSGHMTSRMVLIYYAQVHFRWLHKTKERMLLITSKRKDICKCKRKSG